jgi:hypothetical protein
MTTNQMLWWVLSMLIILGFMLIWITTSETDKTIKHIDNRILELWERICTLYKHDLANIPYAKLVETTQATQPNPHPPGPSQDQGQRREEKA